MQQAKTRRVDTQGASTPMKSLLVVGLSCSVLAAVSGCSDPVPPAAKAALESTIQQSGSSCPAIFGTILTIGDADAAAIRSGAAVGRVTNGRDGATVSCTVMKTDSGFSIAARVDAPTVQAAPPPVSMPYTQELTLEAAYPGQVVGATAAAKVFSWDSKTQTNYEDTTACMLTVQDLGKDQLGGALRASFSCSNLHDPNNTDSKCLMQGSIILENCER